MADPGRGTWPGARWPGSPSTPGDRSGCSTAGRDRSRSSRPTAAWSVPGGRACSASPTRSGSIARGVSDSPTAASISCGSSTPTASCSSRSGPPGVPGDDWATRTGRLTWRSPSTGEIFVSDGYGDGRIVHFDRDGSFIKASGAPLSSPASSACPIPSPSIHRGRLYVADRNNARVQVFDQDGKFLAQWGDLMVPWHIVINETR